MSLETCIKCEKEFLTECEPYVTVPNYSGYDLYCGCYFTNEVNKDGKFDELGDSFDKSKNVHEFLEEKLLPYSDDFNDVVDIHKVETMLDKRLLIELIFMLFHKDLITIGEIRTLGNKIRH
jgi:hypothetical protein